MCKSRRAVDADVREGLDRTDWNEWLEQARVPAGCIHRLDVRQRGAADGDGHRMEPCLAGFEVCRSIVLVMIRDGFVMLVRGGSVMVLGMIVIGIGVDVQRRNPAGGRGHN